LIYWRDIKKTAVVFGTKLLVLLFLAYHSVLSVISFFALSLLTVSLLYRIGMTVIGAVQKTGTGSPYKYVEFKYSCEFLFFQCSLLAEMFQCETHKY
jgi:hypothetical protein